ncbi:Metallo-dependent phosphatase [Microstroma glucosiphilum]|uniref:Metallo-dependent phosphatase n=1 Tax=Pseudomicrostroma glucosiphilum TaxID=1684307 RepID=A0A316UCN0_9BASI|nr:Metallo-dependent phosphatase [Pseudomicrostroma glucosiphilum]PWN22163.1 Metallo-dependent phosphatase [Pseudomicrostroma glucosiphilum]
MKSLSSLRLLLSAHHLLLPLLLLVASAARSAPLQQATMGLSTLLATTHSPQPLLNPYPSHPRLSFSQSQSRSTFKLLVLTDTHLLDDGGSPGNASTLNALSTTAVEKYLEMEKPDYVVHLGDLISGEAARSKEEVEEAVGMILGPMIRRGVPFSTAKGNHDNDKYSTHGMITRFEQRIAPHLSYTRLAPKGIGGGDVGSDNYWVPIYSSPSPSGSKAKAASGAADRPALILWHFDSRSGKTMLDSSGNQTQIEDWVHPSVAGWLRREAERMAAAWGLPLPPSIVFTHIPSHDFAYAQQHGPASEREQIGGVEDESSANFTSAGLRWPGLNEDKPFDGQGAEGVKYAGQDRAYLDAFLGGGEGRPAGERVHAIVSGHQHGNDWCAPSRLTTSSSGSSASSSDQDEETQEHQRQVQTQRVPICFAKHSGFGGYDKEVKRNHGARIFEFELNSTLQTGAETWVRFLTGEKRYATVLDDAFFATA